MHLVNGLAAPCMGGGAWVDTRCWLGERGRGIFVLASDAIIGGLLPENVFWLYVLGNLNL